MNRTRVSHVADIIPVDDRGRLTVASDLIPLLPILLTWFNFNPSMDK